MRRTNPDSLRSCLGFEIFRLRFVLTTLLLARFHQAEKIIVMHLIQGRNNETRLGVEPSTIAIIVAKTTLQTTPLRCRQKSFCEDSVKTNSFCIFLNYLAYH